MNYFKKRARQSGRQKGLKNYNHAVRAIRVVTYLANAVNMLGMIMVAIVHAETQDTNVHGKIWRIITTCKQMKNTFKR
jgi:hypothetical protein